MNNAKYLSIIAVLLILLVAGSALAIALVDPYGLYGSRQIEGFNAVKTRLSKQLVIAKFSRVGHIQPRTVILGSSRTDRGIDPSGSVWPAEAKPVFNFGVPGSRLSGRLEYLRRLIKVNPRLQTVVFGLDYLDYLEEFVLPDDPLRVSAERPLVDLLVPYFGWRPLRDAVRTPIEQDREVYYEISGNGFDVGRAVRAGISEGGQRAYIEKMWSTNRRSFVDLLDRIPRGQLCCPNAYQRLLRQIVRIAAANDVDVILIALPYHAENLELFRETGAMAYADQWLRDLAEITQESRERHPDIGIVAWNFFGYTDLASEALPARNGSHEQMQYFYSLGYFTPRFGNRIVAEIQGREFSERAGARITPDTVEKVIAGIHADRHEYLSRRGLDVPQFGDR
jgi:hypothetical protein